MAFRIFHNSSNAIRYQERVHIITNFRVTINFGYCSELLIQRLEYLPAVHSWIVVAFTMIIAVVVYVIIFAQYAIVSAWMTVLSVLLTLMILSLTLLCQRILVQKIAFDFHRVAYDERLKKSKQDMKVIDSLRKAVKRVGVFDLLDPDNHKDSMRGSSPNNENSLSTKPASILKFFKPKEDSSPNNGYSSTSPLTPIVEGKMSVEPVYIPQPVSPDDEIDDLIQSDDEEIQEKLIDRSVIVDVDPSKIQGSDSSSPTHSAKPATTEIKIEIGGVKKKTRYLNLSGDYEAKKLGNNIFTALTKQNPKEAITLKSLYPYFISDHAAKTAFNLFDKDRDGKLGLAEMKTGIQRIYKEKRDLNSSLNDLSNALGQLNIILYGFSLFITFLFALPTFGVSLTSIIPFSTFFVGLSFIFGGSAKTTFDCTSIR